MNSPVTSSISLGAAFEAMRALISGDISMLVVTLIGLEAAMALVCSIVCMSS